ncbi:Alpha-tocopherol transfer protein-like [Orchesella cincta]|uniref:Alpha-tocopherol transfer protein-like n=1 Tax=Orchesella cincta TaxID=48709 RepID=A0A1D2NFQ6_ORCCI|nr:Alpha-tocopherol transfer protein-like [Orchesella cincta]
MDNEMISKERKVLGQLKKYIQTDPLFQDLEDLLTDDFLLAFVRGRKYDIDKATKTLHTFIKLRRVDYRDFFQRFLPSYIKHGFDTPIRVQGVLKNRDPQGRFVGIDRLGVWDPDRVTPEQGGMLLLMYGLDAIKSEQLQREGVVIIVDCLHISLKHAKCLNLSLLRMLAGIYIDSLPVKYKSIHLVNHSVIVDLFLPMIKMFMSRKLRQRIVIHSSLESLHEAVPREILPESLGGPLSDEDAFDSKFEQRIIDSEEHYIQLAR